MLWILIWVVTIVISYWIVIRPFRFWADRGVKQENAISLLRNSFGLVFRRRPINEWIEYAYKRFPKARYSGMYLLNLPVLLIRDTDLIKQIAVKNFDHFFDHQLYIPEESDPLWGKNLLALTGQKWREMRSTLSPAFTSSKMRYMFSLMVQNSEQFVKHFLKQDKDVITVEFKDTFTRFTNDVIASTAFGVEIDSLGDRDNEFYLMGKETVDFTGFWKNLKLSGYVIFPRLFRYLRVRIFSTKISNFFYNLVSKNIATREKEGIVRPDMINILMEAKKNGFKYDHQPTVDVDAGFATVEESEVGKNGKKIVITDIDIVSQALVFFLAGFNTVSSLLCFTAYELGANQDVQERLRKEIDETLQARDGKITYEALLSMKYFDSVVSETLRKWPSVVAVDRVCTKPYTIQPKIPEEKPLHLEQGTAISLPIFSIHRDPDCYPDPERFDPERFSDENKTKIIPYTYLPFGAGPRNCIGSRFVLLETKALFFHILANFEIIPVEKTEIPIKIDRKSYNLNAENGFWFGLKRRVQ